MCHRASQLPRAALLASVCVSASAWEYPIGKPAIKNGMEIGAVYLCSRPRWSRRHDAQRRKIPTSIWKPTSTGENNNGFEEGA